MRSDGRRGVVAASTARHVAGAASPLLGPGGLPPPPHSPPPVCQLGAPVGGRDPLQGTAEVSRQPGELRDVNRGNKVIFH